MSTQSTYDKWSSYYKEDIDTKILFEMEKHIVLDFLDCKKNDTLLDLWCWVGRYLPYTTKKTKNIVCSDLSKWMLLVIKKQYPDIKWIKSDMSKKLPFDSNSFNKIICTQAIKHVKDINKLFREIHRILKKNGEFIFTVIHPDSDWNWYETSKKSKIDIDDSCYITKQTLRELLGAIQESKLELIWCKQTTVDKNIEKLLTKKSYKAMKGKALILVVKVKK